MLRDKGWKILLTDEHRAKICLDMICEFLHLWPDDVVNKTNMSVRDYSLEQFQWWIGKKIPYNPRCKADEIRKKERLLAEQIKDAKERDNSWGEGEGDETFG